MIAAGCDQSLRTFILSWEFARDMSVDRFCDRNEAESGTAIGGAQTCISSHSIALAVAEHRFG